MFKRSIFVTVLALLTACEQGGGTTQQPSITRLEVSSRSIPAGSNATYTWEVRSEEAAACELDIGNDGTPEYTLDCAAGTQPHTFSDPGSFPATLTATASGQSVHEDAPLITVEGASETFSELSWQPTTSVSYGVAEGQGVALNGKLYIFGGFDSKSPYRCCRPTDRAFVFDPALEAWQPLAPMPPMNGTPYGGVNHAGFTTDGKDIYFAGGYTSNANNKAHSFGTREVWRYNVGADTYTRLPDLPEVRGAGQLEYYDGQLYYFGGSSENRKIDTGELYIFDLAGGATSWREGAPLPNPRNHMGSAVLDGKIYAVAGQHKHDGNLTTQDDVHAYNPQTDSWQQVASLPLAVSHNANSTFVMGGRIIVVGGEVDHLKGVADIFAYDPKADSWTSLTPLPLALGSPIAKNVNGKIVVAARWKAETYIGTPLE